MEQLLQKNQAKKSTKTEEKEYFSQLGVNKEWKSMLHQSSKWGEVVVSLENQQSKF